MKMSFSMSSMIAATVLTTVLATISTSAFAAEQCEMALRGSNPAFEGVAKWRASSTNEVATSIVPTFKIREQRIQRIKADMQQTVLGAATPVLRIVETSRASLAMTEQAHYKNGVYAKYDVSTGGEPVLRATLLLPVSAHTSVEDAQKWAVTDTYSVWAEVDGQTIYLAKDVKSLGLITLQDVAIPLKQDQEVTVYYQRSGNSVYGFIAGRALGFKWNGR